MSNYSEDAPLERDFTYVDDIVEGVINSLDYEPVTCGERFNLGFGNPLSVPKLISLLEKEFAIKAKIVSRVTTAQGKQGK